MNKILLVLVAVSLAACMPATKSADTAPSSITVTPSVQTMPGNKGSVSILTLQGAVNDQITVETVQADGVPVLTTLASSVYASNPDIAAAFESYYAGGGTQAVIRKAADGSINFEKRETWEGEEGAGGGCGPWTLTKTYPGVPSSTTLAVENAQTADHANMDCGKW